MTSRLLLGIALVVACGGRTEIAGEPIANGDASVVQDGGIVGKDVVVPPPDANPPPPPPPPQDAGQPGIQCGSSVCNSATETCCVTFNGQNVNETCSPAGQCNGADFTCSSAANCPPNEVCCGSFSQQNQGSECAPACQGGFQNPQLCATTAECKKGLTCKPTPFGFDTCRP